MLTYRLRPATWNDLEFLLALKRIAYEKHVKATWGAWDPTWQRERFIAAFDPMVVQVVVVDDRDVGALSVAWDRDPVFIAEIELVPEMQRRGLGTRMIEDILDKSRRAGKAVHLRVLKVNSDAQRLYARLGFHVSGETGTHILMEWNAK
jgi:GNAT superfamily N-acetyltransferase